MEKNDLLFNFVEYDDKDKYDDPEEDDFKDLVIIDDSDENGSNQEI